jgi:hypothetical protein
MRFSSLALAFAVMTAPLAAAAAAPPPQVSSVEVTIGPRLQAKSHDYGQRDLDYLARDLRRDVESSLRSKGLLTPGGARLHLVILDAKPNRPTFAQMSRNPDLSMRSVGVGGAEIGGDLAGRPLHYQWWETDIRTERGSVTWSDADRAFQMFAYNLARGRF